MEPNDLSAVEIYRIYFNNSAGLNTAGCAQNILHKDDMIMNWLGLLVVDPNNFRFCLRLEDTWKHVETLCGIFCAHTNDSNDWCTYLELGYYSFALGCCAYGFTYAWITTGQNSMVSLLFRWPQAGWPSATACPEVPALKCRPKRPTGEVGLPWFSSNLVGTFWLNKIVASQVISL